jgi:tetratricopeptide (TPR) repeat protein
VKFWDVATGRLQRTLKPGDGVVAMALSPGGDTLLTGGYSGLLKLWDFATGELLADLKGGGDHVYGVAFSPDGRILAAGRRNGTVQLWDSRTGELQATFRGHTQGVWRVAFSPDGRLLASASEDRTIRLWEVASGESLHVLKGHNGGVCTVVFTDDGRTVVSSSFDANVKLWDVVTGETRATLKEHTFLVISVALSPDSRLLASASLDRTIRLWRAASPDEVLEDIALVDLENRVRTVAELDMAGQQQVLDDVIDYVAKRVEKGLLRKEIYLATSTGQVLADNGSYELAAAAYQSLADLVAENEDLYLSDAANLCQLAAWENRGKAHAAANQWLEAVDSFTKVVALAPDDVPLLRERGQIYVRLGRWKEAVADHKRLVELTPANTMAWLRAAPLFVLADDLEGYRGHGRGMVDRFGASDNLSVAERTIKACVLMPDVVVDLEPLLSRLQSALDDGSAPGGMRKWGNLALAMAAHRAENAKTALERIGKSRQSPGYKETEAAAAILLCLTAMSQQRLGEPEKARHSLRQAGDLIDEHFSGLTTGEAAVAHDWLIAEILRREAAGRLAEPSDGATPDANVPATERSR